jgi:transposase
MTFVLTPGERHDTVPFEELMEGGRVKRPGRGRPKGKPRRLVGDKSYACRRIRLYLRRRGIRYTIPHKSNEKHGSKASFDKEQYRLRNIVERLFNWLKQFRRVATRYEKRAHNYKAMLTIASILMWL